MLKGAHARPTAPRENFVHGYASSKALRSSGQAEELFARPMVRSPLFARELSGLSRGERRRWSSRPDIRYIEHRRTRDQQGVLPDAIEEGVQAEFEELVQGLPIGGMTYIYIQ